MHSTERRAATRSRGGVASPHDEEVVVEEPLEIRISGETLAITMRTPGNDRELVAGFLLAEGVIQSADDLASIVHCQKPGEEKNTIDVALAPGVRPPIDDDTGMLARRGTLVSSACGVCGRRSIDDLLERIRPLSAPPPDHAVLLAAMRDLRTRQPIFERTGGCHAASLVDRAGAPIATFEDIGRHNAVDKVIGGEVLARRTLEGGLLIVSGRASFEIVQKALAARIGTVASVSAPSSLAIDLALRGGVTLAGFVRDDRLTIYAAASR